MVTIAVGDVHGCGVELRGLLSAVDRDHPKAELIFVGDLLTKGPEPAEVVREILDRRDAGQSLRVVCGNHDLRMLAALVQVQSGVSPDHLGKTERQCWRQLAKQGMLRLAMRLMVEASETTEIRDPKGRWTVMHAGIDPSLGLDGTPDDVKVHIKAPEGQPNWWERYDGRDGLIIVGHKPVIEPMILRRDDGSPKVIDLDTGCAYGGFLCAYAIEPETLYMAPSVMRGPRTWQQVKEATEIRSALAAAR